MERHGCIPVSSTTFTFAKETQQNLKKPWESGYNDRYVTSRTHVRRTFLVQYSMWQRAVLRKPNKILFNPSTKFYFQSFYLPAYAQDSCFNRILKFTLKNSYIFRCNHHHHGEHYLNLLNLYLLK